MTRRVPVVLVAGHLGAGKSSLVNHLLVHADGVRVGVVVNDFGAVGIDALLVAGQASSVTSLANGCLCCTTDANGLADLLAELTAPSAGLDLVVVEASGLAEPRELVRLLLDAGADYGGMVVVVDAAEFAATRTPALDEQVRVADLVVVNKIDRAAPGALDAVRALAPGAVVATTHGALDPALLVDPPPARPRSAQLSFDSLLREDEPVHAHAASESLAWHAPGPLHPGRFAAFLEAGPPGVFRAKGVVRFPGAEPLAVQTVGTAIRVAPAPRRVTTPGAELVLIGAGLDTAALRAALERCRLADDEPPPSEHALLAVLRYADDPPGVAP